ncbi:GPI anchored serine-threonine rich protein [Histoplasma capsulatum var. duboisii H88]|uniref:GPI anchored serine-threonine rich protein n=2 Tax=Ajellomyces capsulatus TaxID=5037 RepID=F0UKT3_AJEC8|nr:GPI anchored serine-threonine rich protein [Histoplasma capsulatum H143]EGC46037.1 GPI anchored serine-threonine rich protein [Histoplasma capsulatum var. duboisii H88]QSS56664.1 GPI anchored serine-threonine rich protein [Histoplasma capsulatum var. duboisii H88]
MKFIATVAVAFAALAAASTKPDYSQLPTGNPIALPGLNDIVPVGQPYTIKWQPTTDGEVSLILLRGPSTNVKPIGTIADSIANTGSYEWTPSTDLEGDVTHYGLMIVVEGTGQYQYSTQFGIKNDHASPSVTDGTVPYPVTTTSTRTLVPISTGTITICPPTKTPTPTPSGPVPSGYPTGIPSPSPSPPPFQGGAAGRNGVAIGGIVFVAALAIFAF